MKKIIFLGGHHNSSIPIIKELKKDPDISILFIGHKYASVTNKNVSSEYKEIMALKIKYKSFSSPKFYKISGLSKYFLLIKSIYKSVIILLDEKPNLVFSFGGYLAVPFAIACFILRIKLITHEQTVNFGLANSLISRFASTIFLTWPNKKYTNNSKYIVTGIPLREEILAVTKKNQFVPKKLFVQGGKQGSRTLNAFIFDNISYLTKYYEIYHQTSSHSEIGDYLKAQQMGKKYKDYHYFDYIHGKEYTDLLNNIDFVLSRSGAHFTYEMSYLKIPCIFVPIPWASRNEQFENAKTASLYTLTQIIPEKYLTLKKFTKAVAKLQDGNFKKLKSNLPSPDASTDLIINNLYKLI